ncbi:MAG: hypothetical protein ACRCW5_05945 [Cetobacterium sp.]|uniref:hypothetical protein n=1 Tax=Cetobacterium sp. TaxID=2071632 RepID=UPI003F2D81E3
MLEFEAEMAANKAKIEYLKDADNQSNTASGKDCMNAYLDEHLDQTFYKSPVVHPKDESNVKYFALNASQRQFDVGMSIVDQTRYQQSSDQA